MHVLWLCRNTHFDTYLGLEEVNVFGKVKSVLSAVADHVSVKNVIGRFEYENYVFLVWSSSQRKLQQPDQQVNDLKTKCYGLENMNELYT